jgi:hypothetical protein
MKKVTIKSLHPDDSRFNENHLFEGKKMIVDEENYHRFYLKKDICELPEWKQEFNESDGFYFFQPEYANDSKLRN